MTRTKLQEATNSWNNICVLCTLLYSRCDKARFCLHDIYKHIRSMK